MTFHREMLVYLVRLGENSTVTHGHKCLVFYFCGIWLRSTE